MKDFEVITDHLPLLPLYNKYKQEMPLRVKHHKMMVQGYHFTLKYEKGGEAFPSDYMSRHPVKEAPQEVEEDQWDLDVDWIIRDALPDACTLEEMQRAHADSEQMRQLKQAVEEGRISKGQEKILQPYKKMLTEITDVEGILVRGDRIIVPDEMRRRVVQIAHEGHLGVVKTKQLIKETMWFPNIQKWVQEEIDGCLACQAVNDSKQQEPIKPSPLTEEPWSRLVTDLYGPLPTGEYLLVVQDTYSRFPVVEILHSTKAAPMIAALDRIMSAFGIPKEIGSDNGPPYNSKEMERFATYMGYEHNKKIPYAPWANGMAETFMRSLKKVVQTSKVEHTNWRQQLHRFLRAYRASPHRSTGLAPASVMFNGRKYKTRLPTKKTHINAFHEEMIHQDGQAKETMKKEADKKSYVKESDIDKGDLVLVKQIKRNKTTPAYDPQPYKVIERNGSQIKATRKDHDITRHVNHFKKVPKSVKWWDQRSRTSDMANDLEALSPREEEERVGRKEGNASHTREESGTGEAENPPAQQVQTPPTDVGRPEPARESSLSVPTQDTAIAATEPETMLATGTARILRPRELVQKPLRYRDGAGGSE